MPKLCAPSKEYMKRLFIAMLLGLSASAFSAPLVVDGTAGSLGQDCTFACVQRYQQAYDSSLFSGKVNISAVEFHVAIRNTWEAGNQYRMTIGIASNGVNALTTALDSNFLSSEVFETKSFSGTAATNSWLGFFGDFDYDPTLGDLLISIDRIAGSATYELGLWAATGDSGGEFSRAYNDPGGYGLYANSNYGNKTRFELNSLSVSEIPEPGSLALLGVGLAGLAVIRRRRT